MPLRIPNTDKLILGVGGKYRITQGSRPPRNPNKFYSDFSEYATNQFPSDWTARWGEASEWSIVEEDNPFGEKSLRYIGAATNAGRFVSWNQLAYETSDVEVVTLAKGDSITNYQHNIILRGDGTSSNRIGFASYFRRGSLVEFWRYGAPDNAMVQAYSFTWDTDNWYWMRARINGIDYAVKTWQYDPESPLGDNEPDEWGMTGTQDTPIQSGYVGLGTFQPQTKSFAMVGVAINGETAPRYYDQLFE